MLNGGDTGESVFGNGRNDLVQPAHLGGRDGGNGAAGAADD